MFILLAIFYHAGHYRAKSRLETGAKLVHKTIDQGHGFLLLLLTHPPAVPVAVDYRKLRGPSYQILSGCLHRIGDITDLVITKVPVLLWIIE